MGYYLNLCSIEGKTSRSMEILEKQFLSLGCVKYFDESSPESYDFYIPVGSISNEIPVTMMDNLDKEYLAEVRISFAFGINEFKSIVMEILELGESIPFMLYDPQLDFLISSEAPETYFKKVMEYNSKNITMIGKISNNSKQ